MFIYSGQLYIKKKKRNELNYPPAAINVHIHN